MATARPGLALSDAHRRIMLASFACTVVLLQLLLIATTVLEGEPEQGRQWVIYPRQLNLLRREMPIANVEALFGVPTYYSCKSEGRWVRDSCEPGAARVGIYCVSGGTGIKIVVSEADTLLSWGDAQVFCFGPMNLWM